MSMTREGIVLDMPEAEYHSGPELSSTGAKAILDSPARFKWQQDHPLTSNAFDVGSAVHAKVLGTGWGIKELDFDTYRTKAAQEARDEARSEGLIPMLAHELVDVHAMTEAVLAHPTAKLLLEQDGNAEASMFATDPDTGLRLRCRFDYWGARVAVDLKTTAGRADVDGFAKSAASYKYHVQEAHYRHTAHLVTGEEKPMLFVVVEKTAPHLVGVHQLDRVFTDMGDVQARVARETYARCLETNEWPGYATDIQLVPPPVWATYDHQDRYE